MNSVSSIVLNRIKKDMLEISYEPAEGIGICQFKDDIFRYHVNIKLLSGIYNGVLLHLLMIVPQNYPTDPPKMLLFPEQDFDHRFHEHVFKDYHGEFKDYQRFCVNILENDFGMDTKKKNNGWSPAYSFRSVLITMQSFLADPDLWRMPTQQAIDYLLQAVKKYTHEVIDENGTPQIHSYASPFPPLGREKHISKVRSYVYLKGNLTCFFTKDNFLEDKSAILGYPIILHKDLKGNYEPTPIPELLTFDAFEHQILKNPDVMLCEYDEDLQKKLKKGKLQESDVNFKSAYGDFYSKWLPIYINEDHFTKNMQTIFNCISIIKLGPRENEHFGFDPQIAVEILPTLLNKMIIYLLKDNVNDSISYASIQSYCHYILLFNKLFKMFPEEFKYEIENVIERILNNKSNLRKKLVPDIGNLLVLLYFSGIEIGKNLTYILLEEFITRHISWMFEFDENKVKNKIKILTIIEEDKQQYDKEMENFTWEQRQNYDKFPDIVNSSLRDFYETETLQLLHILPFKTKSKIVEYLYSTQLGNKLLLITFLAARALGNPENIQKLKENYGILNEKELYDFVKTYKQKLKDIKTYEDLFKEIGYPSFFKNTADMLDRFMLCCIKSIEKKYCKVLTCPAELKYYYYSLYHNSNLLLRENFIKNPSDTNLGYHITIRKHPKGGYKIFPGDLVSDKFFEGQKWILYENHCEIFLPIYLSQDHFDRNYPGILHALDILVNGTDSVGLKLNSDCSAITTLNATALVRVFPSMMVKFLSRYSETVIDSANNTLLQSFLDMLILFKKLYELNKDECDMELCRFVEEIKKNGGKLDKKQFPSIEEICLVFLLFGVPIDYAMSKDLFYEFLSRQMYMIFEHYKAKEENKKGFVNIIQRNPNYNKRYKNQNIYLLYDQNKFALFDCLTSNGKNELMKFIYKSTGAGCSSTLLIMSTISKLISKHNFDQMCYPGLSVHRCLDDTEINSFKTTIEDKQHFIADYFKLSQELGEPFSNFYRNDDEVFDTFMIALIKAKENYYLKDMFIPNNLKIKYTEIIENSYNVNFSKFLDNENINLGYSISLKKNNNIPNSKWKSLIGKLLTEKEYKQISVKQSANLSIKELFFPVYVNKAHFERNLTAIYEVMQRLYDSENESKPSNPKAKPSSSSDIKIKIGKLIVNVFPNILKQIITRISEECNEYMKNYFQKFSDFFFLFTKLIEYNKSDSYISTHIQNLKKDVLENIYYIDKKLLPSVESAVLLLHAVGINNNTNTNITISNSANTVTMVTTSETSPKNQIGEIFSLLIDEYLSREMYWVFENPDYSFRENIEKEILRICRNDENVLSYYTIHGKSKDLNLYLSQLYNSNERFVLLDLPSNKNKELLAQLIFKSQPHTKALFLCFLSGEFFSRNDTLLQLEENKTQFTSDIEEYVDDINYKKNTIDNFVDFFGEISMINNNFLQNTRGLKDNASIYGKLLLSYMRAVDSNYCQEITVPNSIWQKYSYISEDMRGVFSCYLSGEDYLRNPKISLGYSIIIYKPLEGESKTVVVSEMISYGSFIYNLRSDNKKLDVYDELVTKVISSGKNEIFFSFLPIYIDPKHFAKNRATFFSTLEVLKKGPGKSLLNSNETKKNEDISLILDTLPPLLNKVISKANNFDINSNIIGIIVCYSNILFSLKKLYRLNIKVLSQKIESLFNKITSNNLSLDKKLFSSLTSFLVKYYVYFSYRNKFNEEGEGEELLQKILDEFVLRNMNSVFISDSEEYAEKLMKIFVNDENIIQKYKDEFLKNKKKFLKIQFSDDPYTMYLNDLYENNCFVIFDALSDTSRISLLNLIFEANKSQVLSFFLSVFTIKYFSNEKVSRLIDQRNGIPTFDMLTELSSSLMVKTTKIVNFVSLFKELGYEFHAQDTNELYERVIAYYKIVFDREDLVKPK